MESAVDSHVDTSVVAMQLKTDQNRNLKNSTKTAHITFKFHTKTDVSTLNLSAKSHFKRHCGWEDMGVYVRGQFKKNTPLHYN